MAIQFEHTIELSHGSDKVFALLDDFSQTPKWLARCTGIEKLSPGPNAAGTKLRYAYRDGGRSGVMHGEIVARTPNEHLQFAYSDTMMSVSVDFKIAPKEGGSRLTHAIEITPRTFLAKLFSPFIRKQLPRQTVTAMVSLRDLLDKS
jgi:uncharacterized protein YndB with AHSA1/START domain